MWRRLLVSMVLVAGLLVPATAGAKSVTATSHGVTATLAYAGTVPSFRDVTLTIASGGSTLYQAPVTYRACGHRCWPLSGGRQAPVQIGDFQNDGAADVMLNLYTGGAHCCSVAEVFSPSAAMSGRYVLSASHDFGDPGYRVRVLDGRRSFVTADDAFAYAFTDYADSGLPLQIDQLAGGRFVDVTRGFPALVRDDATRWLVAYSRAPRDNDVGPIAAWAADECTLGRSRQAFAYLDAQARAGRLTSPLGRSYSGTRFVSRLRALLAHRGYRPAA